MRTWTIILTLTVGLTYGQTADEINQQSKDYLTKNDFKNALPLLEKAANLGHAEAQYNYGICFQQGIEMNKSDSTANIWFTKSAEQGWVDAQFKLAYSYATGRGLPQDYQQAFEWTKKCAEQNDFECIMNLIGSYKDGMGTEKNMDKVVEWATKLAVQKNPEDLNKSGKITGARLNLAIMYRDGDGVIKDLVESYKWFLIYNEYKVDFSVFQQDKMIKEIQELEKNLKKENKKKATNAAEKTLGRPLKNLDNLYEADY